MTDVRGIADKVTVPNQTASGRFGPEMKPPSGAGAGSVLNDTAETLHAAGTATKSKGAAAVMSTVLRNPWLRTAALAGAVLGVYEGVTLMRPDRSGPKPVLAEFALGAGVVGVGLLAAGHVVPRWSAATSLAQKAWLATKVGVPTAVAGVVLGGGATKASADVLPSDPFANYGKEAGKPALKPEESRSTVGIFTENDPPKVDDFTKKGSVQSPRGGIYLNKPNYVLVKATGDGKTPFDDASSPKADSFVDAFSADKGSKNSANYVIDRDGRIVNYVDPAKRALHTVGTGTEKDSIGWNSAAIGIALVNDNTGKQEYTYAQLNALRQLTQQLSGHFKIPATHVLMSSHVAETGGPAGFPWVPWVNSLDSVMPLESVTNRDGSQGIPKLQGADLSGNANSGTTNAVAKEMARKTADAAKAAQIERNKTYDGDGDGKPDDPTGKTKAPPVDPSKEPEVFIDPSRAPSDPVPAPSGDPSKYDAEIAKKQDELQRLEAKAQTKIKADEVHAKEAQIKALEKERDEMAAETKNADEGGVDTSDTSETSDAADTPASKTDDTHAEAPAPQDSSATSGADTSANKPAPAPTDGAPPPAASAP
ncbi:MAG: Negative regulator of beta-lactamase expression, partial [Thermoleophilia bacterium]|nr:Negative regulator of beta-lactamase expression [Thermoleophilia bacterium]